MKKPTQEEIDALYVKMKNEAEEGGYRFNPDIEFVKGLLEALLVNTERYGYQACPCRLATGKKEDDLDIICPCDYRDADVEEFGACYCALYVSAEIAKGLKEPHSIPERRPPKELRGKQKTETNLAGLSNLPYPVWRCKVCGYLCARDSAPGICPICKASKERFERFI